MIQFKKSLINFFFFFFSIELSLIIHTLMVKLTCQDFNIVSLKL